MLLLLLLLVHWLLLLLMGALAVALQIEGVRELLAAVLTAELFYPTMQDQVAGQRRLPFKFPITNVAHIAWRLRRRRSRCGTIAAVATRLGCQHCDRYCQHIGGKRLPT
jgi:hypothetical protein